MDYLTLPPPLLLHTTATAAVAVTASHCHARVMHQRTALYALFVARMTRLFSQDILIKKGIVEKDDVLRGKGIDPDEQRLEEAIVSPPLLL